MFNFNEVREVETIKLPEMIEKSVFKNQTDLIDPLKLKELTGLIIGAGSVGSNLIHTMNKFGFSSFIVYDYDVWETHNSASSIYPYKETLEEKPRCERAFNSWTYYPCTPNGFDDEDQHPLHSIFKVDLLKKELERNDPNLYMENYRVPFGELMITAFTKFNESVNKMRARQYFTNEGIYRRDTNLYKFDWSPKVKPNFMVLTTDSLVSRAKSVWLMRAMLRMDKYHQDGVFPVIDTRTLDTTKGEVLLFDLKNDQDVFDWFNYSIPIDKRVSSFEELETILDSDRTAIEDIPFIETTPNVCGNKMSILISNQISVLATNLIVNLFNDKIEFENIPKLYLLSTNPQMPYVSKMEKILNE